MHSKGSYPPGTKRVGLIPRVERVLRRGEGIFGGKIAISGDGGFSGGKMLGMDAGGGGIAGIMMGTGGGTKGRETNSNSL